MAGRFPLPVQEDVRDLLSELLGRAASVARSEDPVDAARSAIAEYVTDEGAVAAVVACDLAFACRAGAAITLVPPPAAEEVLTRGRSRRPSWRTSARSST